MARFAERILRPLREIEAELATLAPDAPALSVAVPALTELLGTEKGLALVYRPRGDGVRIEEGHSTRIRDGIVRATDDWLLGKPVGWTAFNPLRPEPIQRNRVMSLAQIGRVTGQDVTPIMKEIFPSFDLRGLDQARVLVCEGSSLLAWVGFFQSAPFDAHQTRILTRIHPALRRRPALERTLRCGQSTRALLDSAMELLAAPAGILDARGGVVQWNRVAAMLDPEERLPLEEGLRRAVRGHPAPSDVDLVPVRASGLPVYWLAIARPSERRRALVKRAGDRWSLTVRERDVLGLLAEGASNATIAAHLAIAEGTVEAHLTRIFEKADVQSRTDLVARALG